MRNSKVKLLKKATVVTISMLLTAGAVFAAADPNWSGLVSNPSTGLTGNATLSGDDTSLNVPPVPSNSKLTINGRGKLVNSAGYTADSLIKTTGGHVVIDGMNIQGATDGNDIYSNSNKTYEYGGGAIHNAASGTQVSKLEVKNATISESKAVNGGAIHNYGNSTLHIERMTFSNNEAKIQKDGSDNQVGFGGAVFNGSTASGSDLLTVEGKTDKYSMHIEHSTFTENKAYGVEDPTDPFAEVSTGFGGAIYNYSGKALIQISTFSGNSATDVGGAILNRDYLEIEKGTIFDGNHSDKLGGAITNGWASESTSDIGAELVITGGTFKNNYSTSGGGAIQNKVGVAAPANGKTNIVIINDGTTFKDNYTSGGNGGAISNAGTNDHATEADGLLIINGKVTDYTLGKEKIQYLDGKKFVDFKNNTAVRGGALLNSGYAYINNAQFTSNGVKSDGTKVTEQGGAIYNTYQNITGTPAEVTVRNSTFKNNNATGVGGAIFNESKLTIIDSDFANNSAGDTATAQAGGAIYMESTTFGEAPVTTIKSENKDMSIGTESSIESEWNAITNEYERKVGGKIYDSISVNGNATNSATLNLMSKTDRTMTIFSDVVGSGSTTANVVVGSEETTTVNGKEVPLYNGTVKFDGFANITGSNVTINSGTLAFNHDSSFGPTNSLTMNGGTLDLMNGEYGNHQFQANAFYLAKDSSMKVDVSLTQQKMDGLFKDDLGTININPNAKLTITGMGVDNKDKNANVDSAMIKFTDIPELIGEQDNKDNPVGTTVKRISTRKADYIVKQYDVKQSDIDNGTAPAGADEEGVWYGFAKRVSTPSIAGPVAAQAAFIMMDNIYRQSFANMDMVALLTPEQREMLKMYNRLDDKRAKGYHTGVFAPNSVPEERDGIYFRPFANFESIGLKNGPKVSNVFYGSLIGGESDLIELGHGWDATYSILGAYHGSHQAYQGVDIWQNGGTFGAVGTVYKGRFWSGLTANVGASAADATHSFGSDQFPILMTGAAWKSGYNWGLANNKFIIQPSYMMSYTFVNVFDYHSASGAKITQDPLNVIEIIPGLRFIGNFKNGWQPYLGANITWNIMDKTKFYADEVMLPQLSVKPFVEYGLGVQKRYGDRFTGYGQCMFRSGGRNGVAFTVGMRWALGN